MQRTIALNRADGDSSAHYAPAARILPAGEGAFTVAHASPHLLTNIAVVGQFLPVTFSLEEEGGMTRVTVKGKDMSR